MNSTDVIENENGNPHTEGIEAHLSAMDSPTKPWYLSTKAIFRVVNKAAAAILSNQAVFDQSVYGLNELTKLIHEKTENKQLVIHLGKAQSLIDKLDQIRSDQFMILGDGHDYQRNALSASLRSLIATITEQQKLAEDFLSEKAQSVNPNPTPAQEAMKSIVEQINTLAATLTEELKTKYPEAYEQASSALQQTLGAVEERRGYLVTKTNEIQSYCCGLLSKSNNRIIVTAVQFLKTAQPYAQLAYNRATPMVASVAQWSQPYVDKAMPLLEPVLVRLQQAEQALQHSALTGPVLTRAIEQATLALELAKIYCAAPNPDIAVSSVSAIAGGAVRPPEVPVAQNLAL